MRSRAVTTAVVIVAAGALALTGCSSSSGGGGGGLNSASASGGSSGGGTVTIGFQGVLSTNLAQLGINELDGMKVAIAQANASNTYGFKVKLLQQDDQGLQDKAPQAARALIQNPSLLGVVGPSFSGPTLSTGKIYSAAGVPFVTPSATNATLQDQGYSSFHRIVPNDNVEGSQGADWLARKGVKKLYVLQDLSPYGKGVGDTVAKEAKAKGVQVTESGLDGTSTTNYNPIAQTIKASGADALFYGGYDANAALLAKALDGVGFKGIKVGGNGIKSSKFTQNSGTSGVGWYITCGCQDATVAASSKAFAADYQKSFNTPPSTYSPEAYDATNVLLTAIKNAGPNPTPQAVNTALAKTDYKGITTTVKFQSDGDLDSSVQNVNLYQEKTGKIVQLGNIKDQN